MLINEEALKYWTENFYGYGSWHAKIWFIDYEESGGDSPQEVADKVNYFHRVHVHNRTELCDIRALYKHVAFTLSGPRAELFTNLHDYRFGDNAVLHGEWKNLIAFAHGHKNESLPNLLVYQKELLALTSAKCEALLRLYPLPAHNHAWYYSWLDLQQLDFLKSRISYQDHVYEGRMHNILTNIKTYKPEVVIMYGMDNIDKLKKTVQEFFTGVKFKMIKATKQTKQNGSYNGVPQHHRAELNDTVFLITTQVPALRHNRIETGFDWEDFGKMAR